MADRSFDITNYAWAAGFIDGEGTFGLYKATKNPLTRSVGIYAAQNEKCQEPLLLLQEMFGGALNNQGVSPLANTVMIQWRLTKASLVREAIELLLPHLIVKKSQAIAVLKFANTVTHRGREYRDDLLAERSLILEEYEIAKGR